MTSLTSKQLVGKYSGNAWDSVWVPKVDNQYFEASIELNPDGTFKSHHLFESKTNNMKQNFYGSGNWSIHNGELKLQSHDAALNIQAMFLELHSDGVITFSLTCGASSHVCVTAVVEKEEVPQSKL